MRLKGRKARHKRIRKKLIGTEAKPRLCVFRSLQNVSAQLVDDINSKTILSMSTSSPKLKSQIGYGGNLKAAQNFGEIFAKEAIKKGINAIVFDRAGYKYHGRVKTLAESCRKAGLKF